LPDEHIKAIQDSLQWVPTQKQGFLHAIISGGVGIDPSMMAEKPRKFSSDAIHRLASQEIPDLAPAKIGTIFYTYRMSNSLFYN
jgi:hypothetical protein